MMRTWHKRVLMLSAAVLLVLLVYQKRGTEGVVEMSSNEALTETQQIELTLDKFSSTTELPEKQQNNGSHFKPDSSSRFISDQPFMPTYTLDVNVSIGEWRKNYKESVQNATVEDYEQRRQEADKLDADAAYWLHLFYKQCERMPRTKWQLDKGLLRAQFRYEREDGQPQDSKLDRLQRSVNWYEQGYKLCGILDSDIDTRLESLAWLETAADLGHMGAQRLYHSQARELIAGFGSNLVFQYPHLIPAFKMQARRYARSLFETDHPQGYLLMARMYYVGDVFDQDLRKAYAYSHAAYLFATAGAQKDAQNWLRVIATQLHPSEIADAEQMAHELLGKD